MECVTPLIKFIEKVMPDRRNELFLCIDHKGYFDIVFPISYMIQWKFGDRTPQTKEYKTEMVRNEYDHFGGKPGEFHYQLSVTTEMSAYEIEKALGLYFGFSVNWRNHPIYSFYNIKY